MTVATTTSHSNSTLGSAPFPRIPRHPHGFFVSKSALFDSRYPREVSTRIVNVYIAAHSTNTNHGIHLKALHARNGRPGINFGGFGLPLSMYLCRFRSTRNMYFTMELGPFWRIIDKIKSMILAPINDQNVIPSLVVAFVALPPPPPSAATPSELVFAVVFGEKSSVCPVGSSSMRSHLKHKWV